ncbi:hypothetical protein MMC17_008989 [Xylographa soralifera]|nr:hypothetical protein [Xylographa soralifera]
MDPLSITASIVAVIQISQQLFDLCQTYYKGVKNARNDIKRLRDEVTSLSDILTQISDLTDEPGADALATLETIKGPLQSCSDDLSSLAERLDPGHGKEMKQFGLRALKWPFSTREVDKTLAIIDRHKNMFTLALTADQTQGVADIKQGLARTQISVENTQADSAADRSERYRTSMIKWLTATDPSSNYHAALKKHQPSTGEWLLELEQFRKWKDTRSSLLWLHGIPGCGKTILSSTIVKHLISEYTSDPQTVIAYFYFDFNTDVKQNVSNCLSSLVGQICHQSGLILEALLKLYKKCSDGSQTPALSDLTEVMRIYATGNDLQDIYIVLDALDECPKGDLRDELLSLIKDICSWSPSNIHLVVTGRQESDIQKALSPLLSGPAISIQGAQVRRDIEAYVDHQITIYLGRLSTDLKKEVKDTLLQGANGMFRWVFCQLNVLKKCPPVRAAIRKALQSLPATLDGTYTRVLESIEEETCQELARRCLIWVAFSKTPLCLEDLAEAAVIGTESFDPEDRISDPLFILELLGSLVVMVSDEYDFENSTIVEWVVHNGIGAVGLGVVRLAHFSVKEYLTSERIVQATVSKFAMGAAMAHGHIAEACLLYLDSYQQLNSGPMPKAKPLWHRLWYGRKLPFNSKPDPDLLLSYACYFWWHLRQAPLNKQRDLDYIIWKLFHEDAACSLPRWVMTNSFRGVRWDDNMSPLHIFSIFGVEGTVQLELERGACVNTRNDMQQTALHLAVCFAYHNLVRLLLENGATNSAEDKRGMIPLMIVFEYHPRSDVSVESSLAIMQLLLEHEDKIHDCKDLTSYPGKQNLPSTIFINKSTGPDWMTPLHIAAKSGSVAHCKFLLDSGAEVICQDIFGRNALQYAIKDFGHWAGLDVAVLLLDHGLDVLAKSDDGQTLLELIKSYKDSNLDLMKTIEGRVDDAFQKYDNAVIQSMETVRRDRRKAEIRRLMTENPIDPVIYGEGTYGYDLWKEFYNDQTKARNYLNYNYSPYVSPLAQHILHML